MFIGTHCKLLHEQNPFLLTQTLVKTWRKLKNDARKGIMNFSRIFNKNGELIIISFLNPIRIPCTKRVKIFKGIDPFQQKNSDFIITISLQPNFIAISYFKWCSSVDYSLPYLYHLFRRGIQPYLKFWIYSSEK